MYEVLDDTAAQVLLVIESGNSIRRVAQHLHTPYETVRQAANRLEDAGYVHYDDGLSVINQAPYTDPTEQNIRLLCSQTAYTHPHSFTEKSQIR